MLTFYLVAYATLQMYDIRTNSQSVLLKRISNKFNFSECVSYRLLLSFYPVVMRLLCNGVNQQLYMLGSPAAA